MGEFVGKEAAALRRVWPVPAGAEGDVRAYGVGLCVQSAAGLGRARMVMHADLRERLPETVFHEPPCAGAEGSPRPAGPGPGPGPQPTAAHCSIPATALMRSLSEGFFAFG